MTTVFIDIETIPGQSEAARAQAKADTKPPGTLKKPESIEAWWENEGPAAIEATWRKQALDPAMGEVCAIGYAIGDEQPRSLVRGRTETEGAFLSRALGEVTRAIEPHIPSNSPMVSLIEAAYVVAHHADFDLLFLRARCWANRIRLPAWLPKPGARAPRDYGDTMALFAGYGGRVSLDRLCRALGVASPKADGVSGADVCDLWMAGEHDKLAAYNAADVQAVAECWYVMQGCGAKEAA